MGSNHNYSYTELIDAALAVPAFRSVINPDAPCFANPSSMIQAIGHYCKETNQPVPQSYGEITRCIFDSLALRYKQVFGYLQQMAPFPIEKLHIIGGGSRNNLLNQFTCNAVGVPVIAGPSEGTAIGNIMLQAKANGLVNDIAAMRQLISTSIETVSFEPQQAEDGIRDVERSRGLGDVYKRQVNWFNRLFREPPPIMCSFSMGNGAICCK